MKRLMGSLFFSLLIESQVMAATHVVFNFTCTEAKTKLIAVGAISEDNDQPWRFFAAINIGKQSRVVEGRSFTGFDYDTNENIVGYDGETAGTWFDYRTISGSQGIRKILQVKSKALLPDGKTHLFVCQAHFLGG